jgi:hypothetical protein
MVLASVRYHELNRPIALLEFCDARLPSTSPPILNLHMPVFLRGSSVLSCQLAFDPNAYTQHGGSTFNTDPAATIIVAILRVMPPSAEGTNAETIAFIIPAVKIQQLMDEYCTVGPASLLWREWGPSCTRVLAIPDYQIPDWLWRQSVHGLHFAHSTGISVAMYTVNSFIGLDTSSPNGWCRVDSKVDSWAFEDIIDSHVKCWQCHIDMPYASYALLVDNHLVAMRMMVLVDHQPIIDPKR